MAAANTHLLKLPEAQRQILEAWLMDFERSWHPTRLAARVRELPPPGHPLHLPGLTELVKIDLERQWQQGNQVSLESYLKQYPELGTADTVSADLIQAEYEVRRQFGAPADLSAFARRFPHQAEKLRQLVAAAQVLASGSKSLQDSEVTLVPRRQASPGPEVSTSKVVSASKATSGPRPSPPQPIHALAPPEPLPEVFGHYRILKVLGKGGMGAVYLAHDTKLDRPVALKVPYFSPDDEPEVLERFRREAQAAATLSHPHLCPVYEYGEIDGRPYLTMAYIEGKALSDFIKSGKLLPQRDVAKVVRKLAQALQEAHAHGVIHRDLKPSNVRINQRHEPIVIDFGLARRVNKGDVRLTETGSMLGSPAYMAPEQVGGDVNAVGPGCDIYSLGVILYELLTGRLPFQGTVGEVYAKILTEDPVSPSALRPDVDPQLDAISRKAMAKKLTDRYTSMGEMTAALTSYLRSGSQPPVRPASGHSGPVSPQPAAGPAQPSVGNLPPDPTVQPAPKKVAPPPWKQFRSASRRLRPPSWSWVAAAGIAAILLLGIIILVRTDEGTIKIELSEKADVKVEVDGKIVDITVLDEPIRLKLGEHKLVVTGKDFDIVAPESFTVRRWGNPVVQVTLIPKVVRNPSPPEPQSEGTIKIELSDPGARVEVKVDGQAIDPNALDRLIPLQPGEHDLLVSGKEFETVSRKFTVKSGDNPPVKIELKSRSLSVSPPRQLENRIINSIGMELVLIRPGKFIMGSPKDEWGHEADEEQHEVEISRPFHLGAYEVTQAQYVQVMGVKNPSSFSAEGTSKDKVIGLDTSQFPVEQVSWDEAVEFCRKLSALPNEQRGGRTYRLPTEAEWEYACRAGTTSEFYYGNSPSLARANFNGGDKGRTMKVGSYKPNPFGLFDMHGNVHEWCADFYDKDYYKRSPNQDPECQARMDWHVLRGGSWFDDPRECRAANRNAHYPNGRLGLLGFRVVCVVAGPPVLDHLKPFVLVDQFKTTGYVFSTVFSPKDRLILCGGRAQVKLWDRETKREIPMPEACTALRVLGASTVGLMGPSVGQEPFLAASAVFPGRAAHTANVNSVAVSADGQRALSAGDDRMIILWDLNSKKRCGELRAGPKFARFRSVAFSPNGRLVLAGGVNAWAVYLWDLETGKVRFINHEEEVEHVGFSPDGRYALSAGDSICLWEVETGKSVLRFKGHTKPVRGVAFSPDGRCVYSASMDRTIRKWDATKGEEIGSLEIPLIECYKVAFSPDCRRALVVGIHAKTAQGGLYRVCLLDVEQGREIGRLDGGEAVVNSLAFSSDGSYAVAAHPFGQVYLWQLPES